MRFKDPDSGHTEIDARKAIGPIRRRHANRE
jgi:hypothetical protein